jgi:hypothetical protein
MMKAVETAKKGEESKEMGLVKAHGAVVKHVTASEQPSCTASRR